MKTIGMIGGLSWESSVEYYRLINQGVRDRLGGLHSAQCLMYSVDFAPIEQMQSEGRWDEATQVMVDAARRLESGGADFIIICSNTMHLMAPQIEAVVNVPLLHIADATAEQIKAAGIESVGLVATRYTMEKAFYVGRLKEKYGLDVIIPDTNDREIVNRIIYDELVLGKINESSKAEYVRILNALIAQGAQAIILGCTEIGLLIKQGDVAVPVFDTTLIHAHAAVNAALERVETRQD